MNRDDAKAILLAIDRVEADLVRLQSRLWSTRQLLQLATGVKAGHQYEESTDGPPPERKPQ